MPGRTYAIAAMQCQPEQVRGVVIRALQRSCPAFGSARCGRELSRSLAPARPPRSAWPEGDHPGFYILFGCFEVLLFSPSHPAPAHQQPQQWQHPPLHCLATSAPVIMLTLQRPAGRAFALPRHAARFAHPAARSIRLFSSSAAVRADVSGMKKLYDSADEAVADVRSGSTVLSGGAQLLLLRCRRGGAHLDDGGFRRIWSLWHPRHAHSGSVPPSRHQGSHLRVQQCRRRPLRLGHALALWSNRQDAL